MFLNKFVILVCCCFGISMIAQKEEIKKDSLWQEKLEEVVITGQLRPQSIKKSVFEVKVITANEIKQRAGNNLADILNQMLNVTIYPSSSNGKSDINVLGLSGRYFKVLVDNIPIINEEGFGNNTDLTTINLDDIERVELVEGAMGVQYGANAMSGVLNIITKKGSKNKWNINAFIQEETVGKEYEWFNEGKHIQSIGIGRKLTKKDYINLSFNRNDFRGSLDTLKGKHHSKADGFRGYTWLPKKQHNAKLLYSHKGKRNSAFYKFDFFDETIYSYSPTVSLNTNTTFDINYPLSIDKEFKNQRFVHHLNFNGWLGKQHYNVSFSYQKQEKKLNRFTYFIEEQRKENEEENTYLNKEVWFSRGTLSNLFQTEKFAMQAGYEFTSESGFGSSATVSRLTENSFKAELNSFDIFASGEFNFSENLSIKPEVRVAFTNKYGAQLYYSASLRKLFKNNWEARAVLGYGTATPTYSQLYTYIVDVNHDIRGNQNLKLEQGISANFHLKKHTILADDFTMNNKLTVSYIGAKDRIELLVVNEAPLAYQYENIDDFTSIGADLENSFWYKNLQLNIGASVFGISKLIDYQENKTSSKFYNVQLNSSLTYAIPKINTSLSTYYKYAGKTNRFIAVDGTYNVQTIKPYSLVDFSVKKQFFNKQFEAVLGVRNLFDVTSVTTNGISGGAHSGSRNNITLGYGRSYFLKLAYNVGI